MGAHICNVPHHEVVSASAGAGGGAVTGATMTEAGEGAEGGGARGFDEERRWSVSSAFWRSDANKSVTFMDANRASLLLGNPHPHFARPPQRMAIPSANAAAAMPSVSPIWRGTDGSEEEEEASRSISSRSGSGGAGGVGRS